MMTKRKRNSSRRNQRANRARSLACESLEQRQLLTTFAVTSLADTGGGSLRDAINQANANPGLDVIEIQTTGTIQIPSGHLSVTDAVTINGPGRDLLTVDAGSTNHRVFNIDDGSVSLQDVTLNDMTITGGKIFFLSAGDKDGGGIRSLENLTINRSRVTGNSTSFADADGGGIYQHGGSLQINDSIITNNFTTADDSSGGGVFNLDGELSISRSTISGNTVSGRHTNGGGVFNSSGDLTVADSAILENTASGFAANGGGIYSNTNLDGSQTTTILNSTISGNSAATSGGGVANFDGLTVIENSTVALNSAPAGYASGVGELAVNPTRTEVLSSIISVNANDDDVAIIGTGANSFVSLGHNVVGGGDAVGAFANNDQTGIYNPYILPLAYNGGPTKTHAVVAGPAENMGAVRSSLDVDQRGFARDDGNGVDVGAFERQPVNLSVTTTDDVTDNDHSEGHLSLREAIDITNRLDGADTISFGLPLLPPQTISLTQGELSIRDSLTIEGVSNPILLNIDAQGNSRVFNVDDNVFGLVHNVEISGLTVTGGSSAEAGGGIFSADHLVLDNVRVDGNFSELRGGGVASVQDLTITDSVVIGNTAPLGGGVHAYFDLNVVDSGIVSNAATGSTGLRAGGGIYFSGGVLTIEDSSVNGNTSLFPGRNIRVTDSDVTMSDSEVSGNASLGDTQADLYARGSTLTISGSTFDGSSSGFVSDRVGLQVKESELDISRSTLRDHNSGLLSQNSVATISETMFARNNRGLTAISSNLAIDASLFQDNHGYGIFVGNSNATMTNSTISGTDDFAGDGIGIKAVGNSVQPTHLHVRNSTLTQNENYGIYLYGEVQAVVASTIISDNGTDVERVANFSGDLGVFLSGGHNLVGTGDSLASFNNNDFIGITDPKLAPLADNSGPTLTHALLPDSLALENGSNDLGLVSDQRGTPFVRSSGAAPDIGAFEQQDLVDGDFDDDGDYSCADIDALVAEIVAGTNDPLFDLTGDSLVDDQDLVAWLAEAGAAELPSGNPFLPGDANLDGAVDGQDFILWNSNKFTSTAAWCAGDFNADGAVDGQDFIIWNNNKFTTADGAVASRLGQHAATVLRRPAGHPGVNPAAGERSADRHAIDSVAGSKSAQPVSLRRTEADFADRHDQPQRQLPLWLESPFGNRDQVFADMG